MKVKVVIITEYRKEQQVSDGDGGEMMWRLDKKGSRQGKRC